MLLHFQLDACGWKSPQVISHELARALRAHPFRLQLINVTSDRIRLLHELNELHPPAEVLAQLGANAEPPAPADAEPANPAEEPSPPAPGAYAQNAEPYGQAGARGRGEGGRRGVGNNEPEYFFRSELWNRILQENKAAYQSQARDVVFQQAPAGKKEVPNP